MSTFRNRRWLLALLLLLMLLGSGLAPYAWPDRKLAAAKSMQKELFSPAGRVLSAEERREKWRALREAQKQLSPAQRRELSAETRKRRQAELASYFRMSPAEKRRFLDEQIRLTQGAGPRGAGPPGGRGGANAWQGQGQGGPDGGARAGSTPAERDERRRERLDSTTPAERAQTTQFLRDLAARRAQLGLSGGGGPGPRR